MKQPRSPKIIIAGGGTGGHVFPAIAIATAIKQQISHARILFVGARGRMEMEKVPAAGFHIIGLPVAGLQRRFTWENLLLPWKLFRSLVMARRIVKRFAPDMVIGVGGYASAPVVWAAHKQKRPVLIQEQNSFPGLTNRILGKKARKICVAYGGMEAFFPREKIYITGNPVRKETISIEGKREAAFKHFGLSPKQPVLLITGGSGGAKSINEGVAAHLQNFRDQGIQVIWQTGKAWLAAAREVTGKQKNKGVYISGFIDRMDYAYAAADLVVSRSGAIAVSEICAVQLPAIFIPSPHVAEDHQTKNAQALVTHQAAILLRDEDVKDQLGDMVTSLINDEEKKHRLREKMAGMTFLNAADAIAGAAMDMID